MTMRGYQILNISTGKILDASFSDQRDVRPNGEAETNGTKLDILVPNGDKIRERGEEGEEEAIIRNGILEQIKESNAF